MILFVAMLAFGSVGVVLGTAWFFKGADKSRVPFIIFPIMWMTAASMAVGFLGTVITLILKITGVL